MNVQEAMAARHAVRDYADSPVDEGTMLALREAIERANEEGDLNIQLIHDETDAFGGCPTHYGRFKGVRYCIALIGPDAADRCGRGLDERVGYYGESLALKAVTLGLSTSWVVLHDTETHGTWRIADGERMPAAIAFGHGAREGRPHRSKPAELLGAVESGTLETAPDWFAHGLAAVQLAPSALGKQPFRFTLLADGHIPFAPKRWKGCNPKSAWASPSCISSWAPARATSLGRPGASRREPRWRRRSRVRW